MKNKKGFTLVELLAVIVILGVLLLIAVPAVTSIQTKAKKNAAKDGALMLVKAIETCAMDQENGECAGNTTLNSYYDGKICEAGVTTNCASISHTNTTVVYTVSYNLGGYTIKNTTAKTPSELKKLISAITTEDSAASYVTKWTTKTVDVAPPVSPAP